MPMSSGCTGWSGCTVWKINDRGQFNRIDLALSASRPLYLEVRRTIFTEDGHVPFVGIQVAHLPTEMISHMDAVRLFHMVTTKGEINVKSFLGDLDVAAMKRSCFLLAHHL